MSFGESVFPTGFNTIKGDLFIKWNHRIPSWDQRGKDPEDSRTLSTEAGLDPLTCGANQPHLEAAQPLWAPPIILFVMLVLHRLLGCISAIYSSQFDPRAQDWCSGLYNQPMSPSRAHYHKSRSDHKLGFLSSQMTWLRFDALGWTGASIYRPEHQSWALGSNWLEWMA